MRFCSLRFNLYLLPVTMLLLVAGCAVFHHKKKEVGILRIHIESESSLQNATKSISVLRSEPVTVNISTDPVLTEADVTAARLLSSPGGGFAVEIKFEETAGWRLEQSTSANPGKHLAIFAQWSDKKEDGRWLAAPIIVRRMAGSMLTFTPDASHEEMEKWVNALNQEAKDNAKGKSGS